MVSDIFGRYVWLVDTLRRHKRLTFEEINDLWVESDLSYGNSDDLTLRTFHNHRKAIKDIFDVDIDCDMKGGYKYYIDEPEKLEGDRSEEHTSELQSPDHLVCRLLLEKKKKL